MKDESNNIKSTPFSSSAQTAVQWLSALLNYATKQLVRHAHADIEAVLVQCQKVGCSLPELECYQRRKSAPPALVLFGGDRTLAERLSEILLLPMTFPQVEASSIIWEVELGNCEGWVLRHRTSERQISAKSLEAFLEKSAAVRDPITVKRILVGQDSSQWKFIWIPQPANLTTLWESAEIIGLLARQHAAVIVMDDTQEALVKLLRALGQRHWEVHRENLQESEVLDRLEQQTASLLETDEAQQAARDAAAWQWLKGHCQSSLEREKNALEKALKEQKGKVKNVERLLGQYRQNWIRGFQNQVKSHLHRQLKSPAMEKFLKSKELTVNGFLQTIALGKFKSELDDYVVERLAEFVGGLGALAVKLELPKLSLPEEHTTWTIEYLSERLGTLLNEREIFSSKNGRGKLSKSVTGRSRKAADDRFRQAERACRLISKTIADDWSQWCANFFSDIKKHIGQIYDAELTAKDKPTRMQLQDKIAGIETVIATLHGSQAPEAMGAAIFVKRRLEDFARQPLLRPSES